MLGQFLLAFAGTMLVPLIYGGLTADGDLWGLGWGALITVAAGGLLVGVSGRPGHDLSQREGLLLVVAVWSSAGTVRLPALLSLAALLFVDRRCV